MRKSLILLIGIMITICLFPLGIFAESNDVSKLSDKELLELANNGVYIHTDTVEVKPVNKDAVKFEAVRKDVLKTDLNFIEINKRIDNEKWYKYVYGSATIFSNDENSKGTGTNQYSGSYGRTVYGIAYLTYTTKTFSGSLTAKKPTHSDGKITSVSSGLTVPNFRVRYVSNGTGLDSNGNPHYTNLDISRSYSNTFTKCGFNPNEPYYILSGTQSQATTELKAAVRNSSDTSVIYGYLVVTVTLY